MPPPDPISLSGLIVFFAGALAFMLAVVTARSRRGVEEGATRAHGSLLGIVLQGVGIGIAGAGPHGRIMDPLSVEALGQALAVAVAMAGAVALFVWASRTMGRNWSIVARTRADHQLVQTGPFRLMRHPIYTGMALFMLSVAIAFGHTRQLLLAFPVFALGTWLRIRIEERMLVAMFGSAYAAYAARVKRFVPGLF